MQSYCVALSGVTFLIAYLIMLMVSGLPLFFLELALGQYAGKGPLKVFGRMAPAMKVGQLLLPTIANLVTNYCQLSNQLLPVSGTWLWNAFHHIPGGYLLQPHHRLDHLLHLRRLHLG